MRKRNSMKPTKIETVVQAPAKSEPANGELPNIFRKSVRYDYYDDRDTVTIEPHEIHPVTLATLYETDSKNRGENIDPKLLQEQADFLKCATNPFTGVPIVDSIYDAAIKGVTAYGDIPLTDPANACNTTDRLRMCAIDAAFRNYALNGINTVIRDANNLFYKILADEIVKAGLKTKVVLTDVGFGVSPFVLEYDRKDDELITHPVFCSALFTSYTFGALQESNTNNDISRYNRYTTDIPIDTIVDRSNIVGNMPGNLIDLRVYENCTDFWSLLISILPIFEMNYNAMMTATANNQANIYRQDLVDAFIRAYAAAQPMVISAMENLIYVLWCESEIYTTAKYGGRRPEDSSNTFLF